MVTYRAEIDVKILDKKRLETLGKWDYRNKITVERDKKIDPARRFFRIGTAEVSIQSFIMHFIDR